MRDQDLRNQQPSIVAYHVRNRHLSHRRRLIVAVINEGNEGRQPYYEWRDERRQLYYKWFVELLIALYDGESENDRTLDALR